MDDVLLSDGPFLVMQYDDTPQDKLIEHARKDIWMDINHQFFFLGIFYHGHQPCLDLFVGADVLEGVCRKVPPLFNLIGFVFGHKDVQELGVIDVQIEQAQDELPELIKGRALLSGYVVEDGINIIEDAGYQRCKDIFLVFEVVIDGPSVKSRYLGDVFHGGSVETLLMEELPCRP